MGFCREITDFEKNYDEEIIEILAIIDANGLGAGKIPKERFWTACIDIIAWKESGENSDINTKKTLLRFKADDKFLKEIRDKLKPNSIVKLLVRKNNKGFLLCDVLEFYNEDKELEKILRKQLEPVFYQDEIWGEFHLDKSVNIFQKNVEWCGEYIRISFDYDDEEKMKEALKTGHVLYEGQTKWMSKILAFACKELLGLKNDLWLDEEENEITEDQFIKSLKLCDIVLQNDGEFTFWFEDGDLFWGHSIIVEGNINGSLQSADIAG